MENDNDDASIRTFRKIFFDPQNSITDIMKIISRMKPEKLNPTGICRS